ncbi:LexA family transcriptional regulator [Sulfurospirillum cavolei]|uniref:LexA family transcriptional regulator n=1 Tax=Sulfurospirillum cavolei TaxID=366522 RepID=UPI003FA1ED2D
MTAREELDKIKQLWALKTDEELAVKLKTTKFNIDSWVKRNKIPEKWQLIIGQMSNTRLPEAVSPSNVITIPIFEAVAGCGAAGMLEQLRLSSDNFVFDSRIFPSNIITNNIAMIRIVGDSMAPYLDENDWAIIELRNGRDIVPVEAVYLIAYDDAVQIKRVQIIGKKAVIKSDNKEYEPFTLGINDFDIVGKIVGRLKFGSLMLIKE